MSQNVRQHGVRIVEEEQVLFWSALLSSSSEVYSEKVGGYMRRGCECWDDKIKRVMEEKRRAYESGCEIVVISTYESTEYMK